MEFTIWAYIMPTAGVFVFTYLVFMAICVFYFIAKPKAKKDLSVVVLLPGIAGLVMIISFLYAFSSLSHWAYLLDTSARAVTSGIVEDVRSAGIVPIYLDRVNGEFSTPSLVTIAGVDYYVLTDKGIEVGDHLVIKYCTEGNTVLEWSKDSFQTTTHEKDVAKQGNTATAFMSNKAALLSVSQVICCGAIIFVILFIFDRPISQKRLDYLHANSIETEGIVCPRKISVANCTLEFVVSVLAVISLFSESMALIVFLVVWTICLWGIRFSVQQTFILYSDNNFTYATLGMSKTYSILDVQDVEFISTRHRGCMQLQVHLRNGNVIRLEHINFDGLGLFYQWLNSKIKNASEK